MSTECLIHLPSMFPLNKFSVDSVPYFSEGGNVELRGAGSFESYLSGYIEREECQKCYIIGIDGNTMVTKDKHENDLLAIPLDTFLGTLIHFFGRDSENYSARISIKTLEVFKSELEGMYEVDNLFCVPFFK